MATSFTRIELYGASSQTANGTIGDTVGEMVYCDEPACVVYIRNNDSTAGNTITWAINKTPVSETTGVPLEGSATTEVRMVRGDVLSAIAAADRSVSVVATPYY